MQSGSDLKRSATPLPSDSRTKEGEASIPRLRGYAWDAAPGGPRAGISVSHAAQTLSGGAMGGGVSSAISRALGAGDEQRASALAFHAFLISCVLGLASTLAMLLLGEPIYRLLGGRDAALTRGLTYSNIVFLGAVGIWLTNMLAAVIRAGGNMKVPSAVMMSASIAQVLLAGAFGFGWEVGGAAFPKLGMAGIALGQVIAYSGCALFLLWYLTSGPARVPIIFSNATLRWDLLRDILKGAQWRPFRLCNRYCRH
jgi:Na+-driven multidrug efflux pump